MIDSFNRMTFLWWMPSARNGEEQQNNSELVRCYFAVLAAEKQGFAPLECRYPLFFRCI
jgi:hypothetical protein